MPTKARIVEGSCWACRRRRVKCDLLRPTCTKCTSNETLCDYGPTAPVKWVGGSALRGRNAPHSTSKDASTAVVKCLASDTSLPASPSITSRDAEGLLLYFSNALLPRFHILDKSPDLDMGAIMQDRPLQQAIMAVSQTHQDMFSHATSNASLVCRRRARHLAIQMLRHRLELGLDTTKAAQGLFPVSVLLCMLDGMIEPNEEPVNASTCHLRGGYALIQGDSHLSANMLACGGLQAHLLSIFATMDLVHALLSGERPYFDPHIWHMFADNEAWFGRLDIHDRFPALLKGFSEMAILGHIVSSQLPSEDGLQVVEKCLPSITTLLTQTQDETLQHPNPDICWTTFCALYEICASIYMNRCLRLLPIDDEQVQTATRNGVKKLVDDALPGMMAHCVIFPVLVIGAHAIHPQDREAILQAIAPSKEYLSFGNLEVMLDLLKDIWSNPSPDMQADWWRCFQPVSKRVFLF